MVLFLFCHFPGKNKIEGNLPTPTCCWHLKIPRCKTLTNILQDAGLFCWCYGIPWGVGTKACKVQVGKKISGNYVGWLVGLLVTCYVCLFFVGSPNKLVGWLVGSQKCVCFFVGYKQKSPQNSQQKPNRISPPEKMVGKREAFCLIFLVDRFLVCSFQEGSIRSLAEEICWTKMHR